MKKNLVALGLLILFSSCAFAHSYNVSGEDDYGRALEGTIESHGSRSVSGELSDENGNTYDFEGEWDGYGHISGETDDGASIELDTN